MIFGILLSLIMLFVILLIITENEAIGSLLILVFFLLVCYSCFKIGQNWSMNNRKTYKVRELEMNTVFNIKDSIGGYVAGDSVWVNYSKMMVDPLDSIAMKAVIISEIK